MPGEVFRVAQAEVSAIWKENNLYDRDGITPLLTRRPAGWSIGNQSAVTWKIQGNTLFRAPSSAPFCRAVQSQVLKGNTYDVLYRVILPAITRANGRDVVVRGPGLTAEELLLAAIVFDKL